MFNKDKIYCSKCYKYFEGQRIKKMNNLPKILIIVLKRLLYNKDITLNKVKNNEYLEFPFALDLYNYNYLNDTNNLNNDIITEYNLNEIIIHEGIADTVIIIF